MQIVNVREARLLQELLRAFYVDDDDYAHVHAFNHTPDRFDFEAVLKKLGHGGSAAGSAGGTEGP
eukprot:360374-Chlamydomonas_euryale.AAC.7